MLYLTLLLGFLSFFVVNSSKPPTAVIDLNDKFLQVKDEGFWFVKFYAPWCAHCKRLLPTWEHVAHALGDKNLPIRVAKVDCTRFPGVCSNVGINGYPTIIFFRNGRRIEFHNERSKEALVQFAEKSSAPVVESITANRLNEPYWGMSTFTQIRRDARFDPVFLAVDRKGNDLMSLFEEMADELFSKTRFFSAKIESVPQSLKEADMKVAVIKDDLIIPFKGATEEFRGWVMAERWPIYPRASASNLADMATSEKLIVIVVSNELDRRNGSHDVSIFDAKVLEAAEDMRKAEHLWSRYQFTWLDGSQVADSIVMGHIEPPGILVFNYSSYEYFLNDDDVTKMTPKSILTWLENLEDGIRKNTVVPYGGRSWIQRLQRIIWELTTNVVQMFSTQPLLSCCLFGVPTAFLGIICYSICSADFTVDRDEFYPDDEDDEEEGLLDEELSADESDQRNIVTDPSHPKAE